ncbi:hypothetical protein WUBG_10274 [Wuchereria bancrofti]|uniref:Uncharacterized protein n=1 Tax=Wuchereria bancrofti TaxID=6293 RepID=J9EUB5_WUCBA|nr:hypothetical protein WUBG_10274 [Wuchereria bancrofti]
MPPPKLQMRFIYHKVPNAETTTKLKKNYATFQYVGSDDFWDGDKVPNNSIVAFGAL